MSNNHDHNSCVSLNKSATVEQATSVTTPRIVAAGPRIVNVPVDLGNFTITTSLVANLKFNDPVLEIKDIKKRVIIVQCRLMTPTATVPGTFSTVGTAFPLFIKGFVRKNIQYASPVHNAQGECISSDIKSLTVKVPFELMTTVTPDTPVLLPVVNTRSEFDFFRAQPLGPGFPEKDEFLSSDISQFHQSSTQFYNDLPYCQLISSAILEWDEATDRQSLGHGPEDEGYFHHLVEKMNLSFTVRVLQRQDVNTAL